MKLVCGYCGYTVRYQDEPCLLPTIMHDQEMENHIRYCHAKTTFCDKVDDDGEKVRTYKLRTFKGKSVYGYDIWNMVNL